MAMKSLLGKILRSKTDGKEDIKGNPTTNGKDAKKYDAVTGAVQKFQESARAALDSATFDIRAETKRLHGDTRTLSLVKVRFNDILDKDPKFNHFRPEVKEHLKRLFFILTRAARKESEEEFYKKYNAEKLGSGNKIAQDLFLTNFSLWLMREEFEYDPAKRLSKLPGARLPVWTVITCNHNDLFGTRPTVTASQGGAAKEERVQLLDVFYGLKKFPPGIFDKEK